MQINESALKRVSEARMDGEKIANILEMLLQQAAIANVPPNFVLDYQHPEDEIEEGDWIPVITVSLRPAVALENGNVDRVDSELVDNPRLVEDGD
jgi:hypothetical protein